MYQHCPACLKSMQSWYINIPKSFQLALSCPAIHHHRSVLQSPDLNRAPVRLAPAHHRFYHSQRLPALEANVRSKRTTWLPWLPFFLLEEASSGDMKMSGYVETMPGIQEKITAETLGLTWQEILRKNFLVSSCSEFFPTKMDGNDCVICIGFIVCTELDNILYLMKNIYLT